MQEKPIEEGQGVIITGFLMKQVIKTSPAYISKAVHGFRAIERHGHSEIEIWQLIVPVDVDIFMDLCHQESSSS